jgi:hypothetical protein
VEINLPISMAGNTEIATIRVMIIGLNILYIYERKNLNYD